MKQLYGLEKFAFLDSDGLIYTSRGTRTDINFYPFNYNNLVEPKILLKNIDGDNKKIVIAMPVDRLMPEGKILVACFIEIDMNRLLTDISLKSDNNVTFCNIYTRKGVPLSDLEKERPELMLLDYEMPEMNGSEVLERIRENPELKDLPVVFLTGADDRENVKRAERLKPEGFLLKTMGKKDF